MNRLCLKRDGVFIDVAKIEGCNVGYVVISDDSGRRSMSEHIRFHWLEES